MENKIKKAVILAGGLGTRMLPLTKALPKELLPLGDKPILEHLVRELSDAGIKDICIVINRSKKLIIKHFKKNKKLDSTLIKSDKTKLLKKVKEVETLANITFVYQSKQNGMASAVLSAKPFIKSDPFLLIGGDEIFVNKQSKKNTGAIQQMLDTYSKNPLTVFSCIKVDECEIYKYGNIVFKDTKGIKLITDFIEKPKAGQNIGTAAFVCRAICNNDIIKEIEEEYKINKQESAMQNVYLKLIAKKSVQACMLKAKRFDTGDMIGYLTAFNYFSKFIV